MIKTLLVAAAAATLSIGAMAQASAPMGKMDKMDKPMKADKMEKPMSAASSASGAMMKKHASKPMHKASM